MKVTSSCLSSHLALVRTINYSFVSLRKSDNLFLYFIFTLPTTDDSFPKSDIDLSRPVDCGISDQKNLVSNQKTMLS